MQILNKRPIIQGDVVIKQLSSLPEEAVLLKQKDKIIQASETMGNHHHFKPTAKVDIYTVSIEGEPGVSTITANNGKIIDVKEDSWLYHGKEFQENPSKVGVGDHNAVFVPKGVYYIDIVREWDYEREATSRVVD